MASAFFEKGRGGGAFFSHRVGPYRFKGMEMTPANPCTTLPTDSDLHSTVKKKRKKKKKEKRERERERNLRRKENSTVCPTGKHGRLQWETVPMNGEKGVVRTK